MFFFFLFERVSVSMICGSDERVSVCVYGKDVAKWALSSLLEFFYLEIVFFV